MKMKLVYAWFNFDDKNIFTKQGVTLTDEYLVNILQRSEQDEKQLILEITKNNEYISIFKNEVIIEVSVIVGQNGAGKTTLLENVSHKLMPLSQRNIEGYEIRDRYENEKRMGIRIYEKNGELKVYHNLKDFQIIVDTDIKKSIIDLNQNKNWKEFDFDVTHVFLTNSSLNSNTNSFYSTSNNKISNISLTPLDIKMFANDFYKKVIGNKNIYENNNFYNLQKILISQKTDKDFQQICDLIYFNVLLRKGNFETFAGKISTEVGIWCNTIQTIMQNSLNFRMNSSNYEEIQSKFEKWGNFISDNNWRNDLLEVSKRLKLNWILELDFIYNILVSEGYSGTIDEIFEKVYNQLEKIIDKSQEEYIYTYYESSYNEINKFIEIINDFPRKTNFLPIDDLAYKTNVKCVYSENDTKKDYLLFTDFIRDTSRASHSFVLKYLIIDSLGMSSGERAFLNLFSWLQLISFFAEATDKIIKGDLRDNIILIIDEIDLYCHPEWQRIFIKNMLEELQNQFQGKNIQLILSTHSPIVLSDIPKSNTIYLKKTKEGVKIIDKNKTSETFGSNIFSLFNNSFFLKDKGVIGEYAVNEINRIYCDLSRLANTENKEEARDIKFDKVRSKFIIESIGEPLIKNRIQVLYQQVFNNSEKEMKQIIDKVVSSSNIKSLNVEEIAQLIHDELNKTTD